MYCVNCGVKLADTEKTCPLCGTVVFHPDVRQAPAPKLYPRTSPRQIEGSKGVQVLLTMFYLMPMLIVYLCDQQINGGITWSGYVIGALLWSYVVLILPQWFKRPNPVIFTAVGFLALGVYLLYINYQTKGTWFLSFAFPVTGGIGLIVTAVVTLMKYVPKGRFYIFGGAFIALGVFMIPVELLVNVTFHVSKFFGWSFYPLVVLGIFGSALLYLGINRTAREIMERKFFI